MKKINGYKVHTDSYLKMCKKDYLIEILRCAEQGYENSVEQIEQQVKNIKTTIENERKRVVRELADKYRKELLSLEIYDSSSAHTRDIDLSIFNDIVKEYING